MTAREHLLTIGRRGRMAIDHSVGLAIDVEVLDVKESYGTLRFLVQPVAGAGSAWVAAGRVTLED